ncbi:MAG TPA: ribose-phosphate pyrophosphokinase-like domain-containing protein, partial [Steroidobacteraceae bacterium]|nr:ribose-phosphate pyrophosphokinase-like domain-containing protein [Steroidobacteraceae bacterium]
MTQAASLWSPSDTLSRAVPNTLLRLFALEASGDLGRAIAHALGRPLAAHEEREFEDGEHKTRPLDPVGGADVYVVHSLYGGQAQSGNDKLCRLLFFIGALKDAGAARVTAVVPYLCYARKDRRTKPNDPVTTQYVARMFEAVGADAIVTLEVHNPAAFENAFR